MKQFIQPKLIYEPENKANFCFIWLHGLGANGHDLVPILDLLDFKSKSSVRSIFPNAPIRPISINGGSMMHAWYDIKKEDLSEDIDLTGIDESTNFINQLISAQQNDGISVDKIFLIGFSQGGVIALDCALKMDSKLRGVVCLSSYLAKKTGLCSGLDIYLAHGENDPIIPLSVAEDTKNQLLQLNARVTWKTFPMAHAICKEEVESLSEWLEEKMR